MEGLGLVLMLFLVPFGMFMIVWMVNTYVRCCSKPPTCKWRYRIRTRSYKTGCNGDYRPKFIRITDVFKYCPYCGG